MLTRSACIVHVADAEEGESLEALCRTTQVIATAGVDQVLLVLVRDRGEDLIWSAALAADVRPLPSPGPSIFGTINALRAAFATLLSERPLHAVHLHGVRPCLLGSRALRHSALRGRVLYSPHLEHCAGLWSIGLVRRFLQSHAEHLDAAAVTASIAEAQALSTLLNRSAEVLPHPVSGVFFQVARQKGARHRVLADGCGAQAVDLVTRLSVLLNGRETRVPIEWLGMPDSGMQAQLDAASVAVLALPDEAERAQSLAQATAFIHIAPPNRVPLPVAQAMAAGVPCLVSDTPAHRALIRHGETGFICTSARDYLEKLIFLLRDAPERSRMGAAARGDAERCFTSLHFERALLRAYRLPRVDASRAEDPLDPASSSEPHVY
jgi:glycosyltransferase involved in cell wall biosynthesis